jgi:hypothetical protein
MLPPRLAWFCRPLKKRPSGTGQCPGTLRVFRLMANQSGLANQGFVAKGRTAVLSGLEKMASPPQSFLPSGGLYLGGLDSRELSDVTDR